MIKTGIGAGLLAAVTSLGLVAVPVASASPHPPDTPLMMSPSPVSTSRPALLSAQAATACYRVTAHSLRIRGAPRPSIKHSTDCRKETLSFIC